MHDKGKARTELHTQRALIRNRTVTWEVYIMSTKQATEPFYQTPKFLDDIPGMTGDHRWIFDLLYDRLRQARHQDSGYNKTNEYLANKTNCGISQLKLKLNDLEKWELIRRQGFGSKRKFFLGSLFYRSETVPVQNEYRSESDPLQVGNDTGYWSESGPHSNKSNNKLKKDLVLKEKPDCSNSEHVSSKPATQQEVDSFIKLIATEEEYLQSMTAWKPSPTLDRATIDRVIGNTTIKIAALKARLSQYQ